MGSRVIIIGAEGDAAAEAASDIYFAMPDLPEALSPFVYKLPFEYLSCHISAQQNIAFLGFDNKRRQEVNFRQIFHSAQAEAEPKALGLMSELLSPRPAPASKPVVGMVQLGACRAAAAIAARAIDDVLEPALAEAEILAAQRHRRPDGAESRRHPGRHAGRDRFRSPG